MGEHVRARLRNLLQGFWFVPGLIAIALGALSFVVISIDRAAGPRGLSGAFDGDASAARSILSTIAGSLITVAGLAFTLTVVTLQLVSSQFTPRALRNFVGDRVNQLTAGSFVGIFLYCLLVLRSVRTRVEGQDGFIPALSVTVAILLAVLALGLLLAYIHHVSSSIQVSNIAASVARQTLSRVDRLFPESFGEGLGDDPQGFLADEDARGSPVEVLASRPGYVQVIDVDELVKELGGDGETRIQVEVAPGDFVTPNTRLVRAWACSAEDPSGAVHGAIRLASERDISQDVGYGIRQLADIALRALSPGVNDPTTAVDCIGYLRAVVERLAGRAFPSATRRHPSGVVLWLRHRTFEEYVEDAFVEVARFASANARVAVAVIEACGSASDAAERAGAADRVALLRSVAERLGSWAVADARTERDAERIEEHLASAF